MSNVGYLAVGWLAGAATVVTAALIADAMEQSDAGCITDEVDDEIDRIESFREGGV